MKWSPAPFHSTETRRAVLFEAILNRAPLQPLRFNPNLPARLAEIIDKALEKDRDLRYQHASDIHGAVNDKIGIEPRD